MKNIVLSRASRFRLARRKSQPAAGTIYIAPHRETNSATRLYPLRFSAFLPRSCGRCPYRAYCLSDCYVTSARITTRRREQRSGDAMHPLDVARAYRLDVSPIDTPESNARGSRTGYASDAHRHAHAPPAVTKRDETRRDETSTSRRKSSGREREAGRNLRSSSVTAHTALPLVGEKAEDPCNGSRR